MQIILETGKRYRSIIRIQSDKKAILPPNEEQNTEIIKSFKMDKI